MTTQTTTQNTPIVDDDGNHYELTGEYRPSREGEWYLNVVGVPLTQGPETKLTNLCPAPILRRIEPPAPFPVRYRQGGNNDQWYGGTMSLNREGGLAIEPETAPHESFYLTLENTRDLYVRLGRHLTSLEDQP